MPKKHGEIQYEVGSGNVFADLGYEDAEEALAKADLARAIGAIIEERGLTQAQAAAVLGVDQPKVSALLRGRLSGFSSDRLFRFLNLLDRDIEIAIGPKGSAHRHGRISVVPFGRQGT